MSEFTLERFKNDIKNHVLTVNLDQGVYRDITIGKPNTGDMRYNITTRPGYLVFTGDMGSFTFSRLEDMFNFFRGDRVNLDYWAEKLEAADSLDGYEHYCKDKAKKEMHDWLTGFIGNLDIDDEEFREKIIDATDAVKNIDYSDEHSFVEGVRDWDADTAGGMDLIDFFEVGVKSYTFRYIWCCHAIVHAIRLYDESKAVAA